MKPVYGSRRLSWSIASLFLLSLCRVGTGHGQAVDSLLGWLRTAPRDTTYIRTQTQTIWQLLQRSRFSQADSLLTETDKLANRLDYAPGKFNVLYYRTLACYYQDQIARGLPYAQKALALVNQYGLPFTERQLALSLHGVLYFSTHRYDEALQYYLEAIRLIETHNLTYRVNADG